MKIQTILAAVTCAVSVVSSNSVSAQEFDPNVYYRLTTQFRGPGNCLDVFNGGPSNNMPQLRGCGNYSGQFWNIQPADTYR